MTTSTLVIDATDASGQLPRHQYILPARFDVHEVAQFEAAVAGIIVERVLLQINASRVRYLDRAGVDCLIEARLRCIDNGGDLALVTPSLAARVILELTGHHVSLGSADIGSDRQLLEAIA
ncbi:STAS domain-containing protein [Mycolicibacterium iranicum]|uniref:MlaB-like STAS domain-containing protein n=1 Tax=Mycolicibacterium iranicum TaxID=912594 RepID=A0A178LR60_MYCIR|nr:STAS domain-containing protein [Mycolicibacterium iranicum]OAN34471.1 hypothetical protein A4X20_07155 [Mycolicibacterium iranicum]